MTRYILWRVVQALPTLLGIAIVTFLLVRLTGSPEAVMLPPEASEQEIAAFRDRYNLDDTIFVQFLAFLKNALVLDFGESIRYRAPVTELLAARIGPTVQLALASLIIAIAIGLPLGFFAGLFQGGKLDRFGRTLAFTGQSVPSFYLGILVILIFSVWLGWFPVVGPASLQRLILPACVLAAAVIPLVLRVARGSVLDVSRQDYVRTARSKGLSESQVLTGHIAKNAAIPVVTILGLQLGAALSGAVVTETVFSWPGVGRFLVEAVQTRDFPVVQAVTILAAFTYVMVNLLVDITYAFLDPRIRYDSN